MLDRVKRSKFLCDLVIASKFRNFRTWNIKFLVRRDPKEHDFRNNPWKRPYSNTIRCLRDVKVQRNNFKSSRRFYVDRKSVIGYSLVRSGH